MIPARRQKPQAPNNRNNKEPKTMIDLQECAYDWQLYNFGQQENELILLGMCEEVGELCHAELKMEQGIRGTPEEHEAQMRDAIGDILIYAMNYLSGIKETIGAFSPREDVKPTEDDNRIRKALFALFRAIGNALDDVKRAQAHEINRIISSLNYICALKGWEFEQIARDTWDVIRTRDWRRYPETGLPNPKVEG